MTFVDSWDSPYATWDSGLQWDANLGPNLGSVLPYLNLVTSEHRSRENFISMLAAVFQPLVDNLALIAGMPALYDLDLAVGQQLDVVGQWIGASRELTTPLTGVYFSFDTAGLGFDGGSWYGPYNPVTGIVSLPDGAYRNLLRARVVANSWNGTIPQAYSIWDTLFAGTGTSILIQDLEDMHMILALRGPTPDAVTAALFRGGYLGLKPAGVAVEYMTPSVPDTPYFGFDVQNSSIAGFDTGAWGTIEG